MLGIEPLPSLPPRPGPLTRLPVVTRVREYQQSSVTVHPFPFNKQLGRLGNADETHGAGS